MPKLVVVEGPDGAGKSTLTAKLSQALGWEVYHTGGPPRRKADLELKFIALEAALSAADKGLILDRHPAISEPIYRSANGELSLMSPAMMLHRLTELKPIVVFCRLDSLMDMWKSINRDAKPHKPPEHLEKVLRQYRAIVDGYDDLFADPDLGFQVLRYNWAKQSFQHLLTNIRLCAV